MEEKNKDIAVSLEVSNATAENLTSSDTYKVELLESDGAKSKKKKPGNVLALLSMIFAFVALICAFTNLLFAVLTVFATLLLEIMPFLHALLYLPALIPAILAIVFACIARKKGNRTAKMKLGFIFGIISTAILVISIVGMTVLGIIALILAIVMGILGAFIGASFSSLLGLLVTLSPALAPILAIIGSILMVAVPILVQSFADAAAPEIIELIMEWIRSLLSSGIILLPI